MTRRVGYRGRVELRSPQGDRAVVVLPGRYRLAGGRLGTPAPGREVARAVRRFHRLLSAGWVVVAAGGQQVESPPVQKPKENIREISPATSLTSEDTHGGQEATKDVAGSNPADGGLDPDNRGAQAGRPGRQRGSRGRGLRTRQNRDRPAQDRPQPVRQVKHAGGAPVWCLQPLQVSVKVRQAAHRSGELLAEIVGARGARTTTTQGVQVDTSRLLTALEVGDDPLPALEAPRRRPRLKVLVTPDSSGSCQDWSGVGRAWALQLAHAHGGGVDVVYVDNANGRLVAGRNWQHQPDVEEQLAHVDVVVYLGDGDGERACREYAAAGAVVVALDNHCASTAVPRVRQATAHGTGRLLWVDRVSAKNPDTWTQALLLVRHRI